MPKVQRRFISNALKRSITLGLFSFGFRSPSLEVGRDFGELSKSGSEVFDDFSGNDVGIGRVGAVFEAVVFEPEPSRSEAARQTGRSRDRLACCCVTGCASLASLLALT